MYTSRSHGFTIAELILTITLIAFAVSTVLVYINATDAQQKTRDDKRLNDMNTIERAVLEYRTDIGVYPDVSGTARTSINDLNPTKSSGGWIKADLSRYNSYLPIDPLNNATYHYTYIRNEINYEINCVLEYYLERAQNDGGNNPAVYETGSNLTLL